MSASLAQRTEARARVGHVEVRTFERGEVAAAPSRGVDDPGLDVDRFGGLDCGPVAVEAHVAGGAGRRQDPKAIGLSAIGGGLVVWDRLFGTYEPESERAEFGVLHLPNAGSLIEESMGGWPELFGAMRVDGSWRGAARLALSRPA